MQKKGQWIAIWVSLFALLVGLGLLLTAGPWPLWSGEAAGSVILVNGQSISQQTFDQAYKSLLAYYRSSLSGSDLTNFEQQLLGAPGAYYQLSLKADVAESLIRRTILQQESHKLGIDISAADVKLETQRELQDFLRNNGVPPAQIERTLNDPKAYQSDFTLGLMEQIRDRLRDDELRQRAVHLPQPTRADLESYYKGLRARYYRPALVRVRRILIKLPKDATAQEIASAREKLEGLQQQIQAGASFSDLARKYSQDDLTAPQGGEMGWIQAGDPEGEDFVHLAFSLKPGEVGGPVRTQFGSELLQTEEIRPPQGETFDSVARTVTQDYLDEKTKAAYLKWFDGVYNASKIEVKSPLIAAYRLEKRDLQAALRQYEAIRDAGKSDDPYLGYYIARLYRQELDAAQAQLKALPQSASLRTPAALESQISDLKGKVITGLQDVLKKGQEDADIYEAILELDPQDQDARFQYAGYLMGQGKREEALAQLETLLKQVPDDLRARAVYGKLLFDLERYPEAAQALQQALAGWLQHHPNDSGFIKTLRLTLAQAERKAGQPDAARTDFAAVLKDDPQNFEANRALGEMALYSGDSPRAILHLEIARGAATPDELGEVRAELGQAYLAAGEIDKAQEVFQEALESKPPANAAYLGLGQIYERQGHSQQALDAYQQGLQKAVGRPLKEELAKQILALDPNDVRAHLTLADLAAQSHQYADAIAQYRAVLDRQPSLAIYRALGDLYLESHQLDQALAVFRQAMDLQPTPQEALGLWARILRVEQGRTADQHLSPPGQEALYQLARLSLLNSNDAQKAASYLAQLRAVDPSYRAEDVANLIEQLRKEGVDLPQTPSSAAK